jgi:hypothetical protein
MRTTTSHSIAHRAGAAAAASLLAFAALSSHATQAHADEINPNGKGVVGGALLGAEIVTIPMGIAQVHPTWAYLLGGGLGAIAGGVAGYEIQQNVSDTRVDAYMLVGGLGLVIPALVLSLNAMRYQPSDNATEDRAPTNAPAADPGAQGRGAVAPPATYMPPTAPSPLYTAPSSAPAAGPGTQPGAPGATPTPAPAGATPPTSAPAPAPAPAGSTTTPPAGGGATPPLSLFDVQQGDLRLGLPVPEVRPMFSMAELRQYGMTQQTEVRMPLVKVTF